MILSPRTRISHSLEIMGTNLMLVDVHRVPLDVHLCAPSSVPVVVCPQLSLLVPPVPNIICTWVPSPLLLFGLR